MALSAKLVMRQGQSLVMTPQLLQAIKLLQLSNLELASFIEEELERNPLLERADEQPDPLAPAVHEDGAGELSAERDWTSAELEVSHGAIEDNLGTEIGNTFDGERTLSPADLAVGQDAHGLSATSWSGAPGGGEGEAGNLESFIAAELTLHEHLKAQLSIVDLSPAARLIGHALIDAIDEAGYLGDTVEAVAERLGTGAGAVEAVLAVVHGFDPTGIGARSLAECLTLQLKENNRFDPAMASLIDNLDLLGKRDYPALRRLCRVDEDDLADMVGEIRRLDPKPGRRYGGGSVQTVVPDVYVWMAADGGWNIELNTEVLPRVLVNQVYHARVHGRKANSEADRSFVANCLQTANWLTKSLEQRARTILKVSSEIVRQQDAFFAKGVEHLRPLNLKAIAEAIGMHESTVSRVTSNKYMATPRGLFELKYFFTASIASSLGGDAHSAEAVRFRIKQMIDGENPGDILSDDAIVVKLKAADIMIARRTVAKYRESLKIPSSVERRRDKQFGYTAG